MQNLHIQKFLRNTPDGVEKLKDLYGIDCKQHKDYPSLHLFKYSQIDSPFSEPIVQEARGIILDKDNDWNVVSWAFPKFCNFSEGLAAKIDWMSAEVQEKIDGSLCQLYWYDNKWNVATSGTPDASGLVNDYGMSFADLFWKTAKEQGLRIDWLGKDFCWIFELTSPYNRIVVEHSDCKIWALTSRHVETLRECPLGYGFANTCSAFLPKRFPLHSVGDCIKAAEALVPTHQEGFVVVDKNFNRIKIKSPAYVMLHHAKDSLSRKRMCEIVRKGESEEFKTAIDTLPELKKVFDEIVLAHKTAIETINMYYNLSKYIPNQKDFALRIRDFDNGHFSSVLFQMRKTGLSAQECLASHKITLDSYMEIIGA